MSCACASLNSGSVLNIAGCNETRRSSHTEMLDEEIKTAHLLCKVAAVWETIHAESSTKSHCGCKSQQGTVYFSI